jgi:iron complex transport system ATP-binding protein
MQITINGLQFSYTSTPILNDVNADLSGHKLVSILGPNGVGKSTLIHCINKILTPKGGVVLMDGKDVKEITIKEMSKKVGYVPYSANDSFPLSVVDTVMMGRHPHSKWGSLDNDLRIVYETLEMLGISHLAMRNFNELSAGQHQKVMLARGLVQEPEVLLLDEPTSNLDVRHQIEVTKLLKRMTQEKNILTIMISHDINIAAKYSDEIIMMHQGKIYATGTPEDVINEENLRAVYGVEAKVITDLGAPHVILRDSIPTDVNNVEGVRSPLMAESLKTSPQPSTEEEIQPTQVQA